MKVLFLHPHSTCVSITEDGLEFHLRLTTNGTTSVLNFCDSDGEPILTHNITKFTNVFDLLIEEKSLRFVIFPYYPPGEDCFTSAQIGINVRPLC